MAMASSSSSSALPPPPPPPPPPNLNRPIPNPTISPLSSNPSKPPFPPSPPLSKIQERQPIVFPISSSSRGFPPKTFRSSSQPPDQVVTIADPMRYPTPSGRNPAVVGFPPQARPFGFRPDHQPQTAVAVRSDHVMRPPPAQSAYTVGSRQVGNMNSGVPWGVPAVALHPKIAQLPPMSSTSTYNNYKDQRVKNRDDAAVVTIHDRKVRLSDAASGSVYALCRSWLRNGLPQENQPQIGERIKLLPRPLPTTMTDTHTAKRDEADDEDEFSSKEHDGSVENLSARDLLEGHIKRAKRVRARLREGRLKRIDRYRQRLSLLLPPPVEHCRNDVATGS